MPQPGRAEALSFCPEPLRPARPQGLSQGIEKTSLGDLRAHIARIESGRGPQAATPVAPRSDAFCEVAPAAAGDMGAATGFALMLAGRYLREKGAPLLWIAHDFAILEQGLPYGPGLAAYGVPIEAFVLMRLRQPLDLWRAMEEALKANVFSAVIAEPAALTGEDLPALVRRLVLCARTYGSRAILLRPPSRAPFLAPTPMRFEIAARSAPRDVGLARPLPGPSAWNLRHRGAPGSLPGLQPDVIYETGLDVSILEKASSSAALPFSLSSAA
jgi:hypothetical protein